MNSERDGAPIVIGVGNPYRRDDGIGPAVIERLRRRHLPGVNLAECDGEPTRLLDLWADAEVAIVVDAIRTASPRPGTIHRRSLRHPSTPRMRGAGTHAVDLGDAVALAAALDLLPRTLLLYAVEAGNTSPGEGLTPPVQAVLDQLVDELVAELTDRRTGAVRPRSTRAHRL
jgi:hydrogenase maturation protease